MKKVFLLLTTALILAGAKCSDLEQTQETNYYNFEYQEDNDMALSFKDDATLAGRYQTEDSDYPNGTFKDAVVGNDGTPYSAEIMQNIDGLLQALLALGKITASGDPDTAVASEYLQGLLTQYGGGFSLRDYSATDSDYDDYEYTNLTSEGITYGGVGDNEVTIRTAVYDVVAVADDVDLWQIDASDGASGSTTLYNLSVSTAIPLTGLVPHINVVSATLVILAPSAAAVDYSLPVSLFLNSGSTSISVLGMRGIIQSSTLTEITNGKLYIQYAPPVVE